MAIPLRSSSSHSAQGTPPLYAQRFDWTMIVCSSLLVGGIYLDGWAHLHNQNSGALISPWHLLLFVSAGGTACFLLSQFFQTQVQAQSWRASLPQGYRLSLLGVVFFFIGAIGDPIWHRVFGLEVDVETLLSPPHLILGTGIFLIVSGPFRALWRRIPAARVINLRALLPLLISLLLTFSLLTFFTEYIHPGPEALLCSATPISRRSQRLDRPLALPACSSRAACSWVPFCCWYGAGSCRLAA
jgi:hypothetical protein